MKNALKQPSSGSIRIAFHAVILATTTALAAATNSSLSSLKGGKADRLHSRVLTSTNANGLAARLGSSQGIWMIEHIGPDEKTWVNVSTNASRLGAQSAGEQRHGERRVVELGTGMNYWDGQSWVPSDPSFDVTADAFVAERVRHKVRLDANLNKIGAVTVTTGDGIVLHSTPVGIGLYDAANGQFAILAAIKDCAGVLVSSNRVVYENAFNENGVQADVIYAIEKGSFEQDIVFRGRLNVADYGFPTNTTRIQIFTEFYGAPVPDRIVRPIRVEPDQKIRLRRVSPDLVDEILGFGELAIPTGRARMAGVELASSEAAAPIVKQFTNILGRTLLIESVEYHSIDRQLKSLPEIGSRSASMERMKGIKKSRTGYAAIPSPRSPSHVNAAPSETSKGMASVYVKRPGVVVDYLAEISGNITLPKTFQGDTTYVLTDSVTCSSSVTIEGGAVFKAYPDKFLKLTGSLTCKTTSYRPAIFTARDDDTVGDAAPGSDGDPTGSFANPALHLFYLYGPTMSNLRFKYCQEALRVEANFDTTGATISHSQFVNCVKGIVLTGTGSGSGTATPLTVHNSLIAGVQYPLTVNAAANGNIMYHCTIDSSTRLVTATASSSFNFVNSIVANVPVLTSGSVSLSGSYNGFYPANPAVQPQFGSPTTRFTSAASPFQSEDSGSHYLTEASGFRAKGTTSVGSTLLTALKTKTTYPPFSFLTWFELTEDLTLFPQTPRYVSGPPDLGAYYDALDYTIANIILRGGRITVKPGTTIGLRSDFFPELGGSSLLGFEVWEGSSIVSHGLPTAPITYADINQVQENALGYDCAIFFAPYYLPNPDNLPPPVFDFRFSNFYLSPGSFSIWGGLEEGTGAYVSDSCAMKLTLRDCNLRGGRINLGLPFNSWTAAGTVDLVNNLFDRVDINLDPDPMDAAGNTILYIDLGLQAYNNLFRGGRLRLVPIPASAGSWIFKDNLFDKEEFVQDTSQPLDHDYNAYYELLSSPVSEFRWGGTARLTANNGDGSTDTANDQGLASTPPYQVSMFGEYYLATSSPLYNISQRGSHSPADAGLYHYTTRVDQTKDGAQTGNIIIGRHYVATVNSSSNVPKDTDNDGIPDYAEDRNGNNVVDSLETNPNIADSALDLDGDQLTNLQEYILGTNPFIADSDSDEINDGDEDFDGDGISNWAEFQQGSDPLNRPPFATPQSLSVTRNTPKIVALTGWDWEYDPLTFSVVAQPAHGTLSGTAPNLVYSPAAGYTGWDSFSFKVNDGHGDSFPAAIHLLVSATAPVPVANPQDISMPGSSIAVTLTGSSGGGGSLTFSVVSGPLHGTLSGTAPNLTYTPTGGYQGGDFFSFKVNNGNADSAPASVNISRNVPPVVYAGADQMAHLSDTVTLNSIAIDDGVPVPSPAVTWSAVSGPGSVTFGDVNSFTTTANFNSVGTYTLRLTANDSQVTAFDDVLITVRPDGELIIAEQPADQTTELGGSIVFAVSGSGGGQNVTFAWRRNGAIVGTDSWLEIDPVETDDAGDYYVVVSDGTTTLTSRTAHLAIDGGSGCVPAPPNMVAWWRAENNALENSGSHNGTILGATFSAGKVGQAFSFDNASARITVSDHTQFAFSQSLSAEGWIYVNAFSHGFIFVRGNNQAGVFPYYLSVESGGTLRFYINSGSSSDQLDTSLSSGQWHHIAAVLDDSSSQMLLYVDGALANSKTTTVRPFANMSPTTQPALGIGNHPIAALNAPFSGKIDELAVYSGALSSYHIGLIFNAGAGKCVLQKPRLPYVQFNSSDIRPIPASVTLSVPGFPVATIYYTLNGKIPTRSTGTVYSAPIQLIQPSTIIAFASMQDCQDGPTAIQKFGYPVDPIRLMGNNQIGIPNGELLLPFTADITALVRNRSAAWGQEVTFTARSPSGADITANLWNVSDWTGSSGFLGIVSTFLTLGNETGVYTVTAHYGGNDVTFEAETVTPLSVTGTDENYAPGPGIEDPSRQLVSVSGQRPNITHVLGADLSNGQGMITGYAETAPGSGMFAPDTPPLPPSPSQSPGFVTKYASADYTKDFRSYWDDSDEFELDFLQADLSDWGFLDPKESRGSARSPYRHLVWNGEAWDPGDFPRPPGWIDMTKHFLKVAGYNAIQSTVLGMTTYQFIPDQAHVLYISTHGYHDGNTLVTQDGLFSPLETDWGKGLSMVVIAGCSVLDVTGSKPRWAGTQSANIAPGRKWAATGPCVLLGYEESAPIDRFLSWNGFSDAGPKQVVSQWIFSMEFELASPIYAWMYANWYYQQSVHKNCHNATAIHACSTPKKAYHLIGNLGATFLSSLQEVPESQWKGQD